MAESERQEEVAATVAVEIFGVPYSLREDGAVDAGRLRELAEKVDRKMREVADQAPNLEPSQIAVLAALNLANEANGGTEADGGRYRELVERVSILTSDLEAALDA
ncbi:MAG: cell division protein ZapA [Acidobacteria bacterium]|nr:cell division protein ZapA [Acidobacteriota bacterium]MDE2978201.1 cell division protein ZapA [Acidobacteriota bacterium]